ncbi:glycosyltransferase domain-containing protein [Candidatus Albibeggiatoa sp. nov. NOAA]|uniref:glycosyltransferase domain-containing protein n=1 Tax=Candidatus Albibeggiatoa sp. nov. NOAA TaxID=3162724 RepID=UPI003301299A|nr:DUF616 domain-containing protein [Thiotrichaceae bacterium]
MSLDAKWVNKIQVLVASNPKQMSVNEYSYIAEKIASLAPCNLLVFGLGNDSLLWQEINTGGKTVFLENDKKWFDIVKNKNPDINAHIIHYKTTLKNWANDLIAASFDPHSLELFLPAEVSNSDWRCIIVDAPPGYSDKPGRLQSIHAASKLAYKNPHGQPCDIFAHDCNRILESTATEYFLSHINLQTQIDKTRHYQLIGHDTPLMKKAIYTAMIDDRDSIPKPHYINEDYDYFLFTNQDIKSDFWNIIKVEGKGIKLAQHIKIRPDIYLSDYDFSIWLDKDIIQTCDINSLTNLSYYDMATMKHPQRNCIYQEAAVSTQQKKDAFDTINKQVSRYKAQNYPFNHGLIASNIIFRYHNDKVKKLMTLWDNEVQTFSYLDQLSFNYCLGKKTLNLALLPWSILQTHFSYIQYKD